MNAASYDVVAFPAHGSTPSGREGSYRAESAREAADSFIADPSRGVCENEMVIVFGPDGFYRYRALPDPTLRARPA